MAKILEGAEPFLLQGGREGVLLVHGFTGSPAEMLLLGEFLHGRGYTVLAPRLCGHGTSPKDLEDTDWENWYHSACDGYFLLKNLCDKIYVVGLSMGGLLAMKLGSEFDVERVVSLSAPIYIADRNLGLLPPIERTAGLFVPKKRRCIPNLPERYSIAYRSMPLRSIHNLLAVIEQVKELLPKMDKPLLVVQSKSDHTVLEKSGSYIYDQCGSAVKQILWLEKSGHLVTLDIEHDLLFREIDRFFQ